MIIGIDIRLIGKKQTGSEAVFFNLVKNLSLIDDRNDYKLFTDETDAGGIQKIKNELKITDKKNFEIVSLKTQNRFSWNFWSLASYLRNNPVDVYLTQYITPWFVPKKIRIMTIIHDISFNFYPQFIKKSDLIFLKTLIPISLRRADRIIAVSKFTRDEIIRYYKIAPEKVDWIYNAVSEDFLKQDISSEKIRALKEKYGLPEKYILYIGTLQPRKNIPTLIKAYSRLKEEKIGSKRTYFNDLALVIAGGRMHNFDTEIEKAVKKSDLSDKIFLPGYIDEKDKAALMAGAKMFIYPSLYEGFGIPILEAMSAGVPVLASGIAPHREIAGEAAMFFDPQDETDLENIIRKMLKDTALREKMKKAGLLRASEFKWKNAARRLLLMFDPQDE